MNSLSSQLIILLHPVFSCPSPSFLLPFTLPFPFIPLSIFTPPSLKPREHQQRVECRNLKVERNTSIAPGNLPVYDLVTVHWSEGSRAKGVKRCFREHSLFMYSLKR